MAGRDRQAKRIWDRNTQWIWDRNCIVAEVSPEVFVMGNSVCILYLKSLFRHRYIGKQVRHEVPEYIHSSS